MKSTSWRVNATKALYIFIVSLVVFASFAVQFRVMTSLAVSAVVLISVISWNTRRHTFPYVTGILATCFFAYGLNYTLIRHRFVHMNPIQLAQYVIVRFDWIDLCFLTVLGIFCLYSLWLCFFSKREPSPNRSELMIDQKYDLERIGRYVKQFEIVGVNGSWGSGKTFLTNEFIKENSGTYDFIVLGLLHCNLDEILSLLLSEMEKVLMRNGISSSRSRKLKAALDNSGALEKIINVFIEDDMTLSTTLESFKEEFKSLNKPVIIVLEDIDRIADVAIIKKVFSISEQLIGCNIKVLYQYCQAQLNELGFDRSYTEKYIPYTVNLTPIDFLQLLKHLHGVLKIDEQIIDMQKDFNFINLPVCLNSFLPSDIISGHDITITLCINGVSIRKAELFLKELDSALKSCCEYKSPNNKKAVVLFFLVKHFLNQIYEVIHIGKSITDTLLLKYENDEYTIFEFLNLLRDEDDVEVRRNALRSDENIEKLAIIYLFGYNLRINETANDYQSILNEPIDNIKTKNSNEKIDRLIWNLCANGTSELSDFENAVYEMERMVLDKPIELQCQCFEEFWKKFYDGNMVKSGNTTVFKLGVPSFISLFQAFGVVCNDAAIWIKLIDFYFLYHPAAVIDFHMIAILNTCRLDFRRVFLNILHKFNELPVAGSMYPHVAYHKFLERFIGAYSSLGYVDTRKMQLWKTMQSHDNNSNKCKTDDAEIKKILCEDVLPDIKAKLLDINENIPDHVYTAHSDLITLARFIDKNLEILNCDTILKPPEPKFNANVSSRYVDQEEFDRLRHIIKKTDVEKSYKEVDKSYSEERILALRIPQLFTDEIKSE